MRIPLLRLALTASMLAWPLTAAAEPPPNVSGIQATLRGAEVVVEWQTENETIAAYNVYLGQKSILENQGAYDDFVTVSGRLRQYIITEVPPYSELFVTVTALNGAGEESVAFTEEVRLDLAAPGGPGEVRTQEVPSPSQRAQEANSIALLSAESRSPTEVVLNFSRTAVVPVEQAAGAFQITSETGQSLSLLRLELQGAAVIVTTTPQIPQTRYDIVVSPVVSGANDAGGTVPLDQNRNRASFTGFGVSGAQDPAIQPLPEPLTSSGAGAMSAVVLSGAVTGWRRIKKFRA